MTELFADISQEVRSFAETAWQFALLGDNPVQMTSTLSHIISLAEQDYTSRELEFLNFYFNLQMEKMKNENSNTIG